MTEPRLGIVLLAMLTLPGWAILSFGKAWRHWRGLQRWIVAVGLSIAFYPAMLYGLRLLAPFLTLGPYKMGALLLTCAIIAGWRLGQHWKALLTFDRLEWVAILVFGMTVFTRLWIIRDHPYPAWSDSLHHTLLTQLTAQQGKLPSTLEPFFPISLNQYHLGLYALAAPLQWLAQVPAHTALLWTAQVLNGLCGLGIYLVLDREVGRTGAVVGAAVAGLLSHQPALYVNWGRFTQVASQAVLLIAWLVTWEAIKLWQSPERLTRVFWAAAMGALLSGAVFLFHFRVAAFYAPLVVISLAWEWWRARRAQRALALARVTLALGFIALVVVAPALGKLAYDYVDAQLNPPDYVETAEYIEQSQQLKQQYHALPLNALPTLVAHRWLMALAGVSAVVGLLRRNRVVVISLSWMAALFLIGKAYLLGISFLDITNLSGIVIMFYLPIGLIVGSAAKELLNLLRPRQRRWGTGLVLAFTLVAGLLAIPDRTKQIEPYRHFVTPADVVAMEWIKENIPADARFAVNTFFWLPGMPHGTDAGYWIPYFTGRRTNMGVMLDFFGPTSYLADVIQTSTLVEQLEVDNAALAELQASGVEYVYIGSKGDFSGPGLNASQLSQSPNVTLLYQNAGVSILKINPP